MAARGKRKLTGFGRSLQQKPDGELERIALNNAHDERALWAVFRVLQHRRGKRSDALKRQIHERPTRGKPLPLSDAAIWRTATPRSPRRPWYATLGYLGCVVAVAVLIAVARVTEADANLLEMVVSGVQTFGTYLTH